MNEQTEKAKHNPMNYKLVANFTHFRLKLPTKRTFDKYLFEKLHLNHTTAIYGDISILII